LRKRRRYQRICQNQDYQLEISHAVLLVNTGTGEKPTQTGTVRFVPEPPSINRVANQANRDADMAKAKKQTSRGRNQDRARVAGGQDYEVRYEAKKTRKSAATVKKAVKKVGSSRKRVEWALSR
jgi:hypothetical protein